jgi:tetratricopeptide (TPR) repeat protein
VLTLATLVLVSGLGAVLVACHGRALYSLRAARADLDRHHNIDGYEHARDCLRAWPGNAEALLLAARAARRLDNLEPAERYLERYQSLHGSDDRLVFERFLLRTDRGEADAARGVCQALLEQDNPDGFLLLEAMARGYLRTYRLSAVDGCLAQWLVRRPDHPQALTLRGQLYEQAERRQDAAAAYRRALEVDPDHDEARMRLTALQLQRNRPRDALADLALLSRKHPDDPLTQVRLAYCLDQTGEPARARALLDDLLARRPDFGPALAERGRLAAADGQLDQAERWLRAARERNPADLSARYQLYLCLRRAGKEAEALEEWRQHDQLEANFRRQHEIILEDLQRRPHDPALHFEMATLFFRLGMIDDSLRWLQSTLREDPHHAEAHRALAGYYRTTGHPELAAEHQELGGPEPPPR